MREVRRSPIAVACMGIAIAGVVATNCAAREVRQPPAETGLIGPLINNPVCGTDETLDAWPICLALRQRRPATD